MGSVASDLSASRPQASRAGVSVDLLMFFVAVAEEMSFTRAARRLGIDQSWLSHKIRQLEAELQCSLFTRTTRRIELTAAGRALLEPAQALARAAEEARRAADAVSAGLKSTLRVGALPYSFYNPARRRLIDDFVLHHPEVDVEVCTGPTTLLLEQLRRNELDLAFVSWPFDPTALDLVTLRVDRFLVAVPKPHRLATCERLCLGDLKGERLASPNPKHSPGSYESLFKPFFDAGAIPALYPEFNGHALWGFARTNGICFLVREDELDRLGEEFVAKPIEDFDAISPKCLVRRKDHLTPPVQAFWEGAVAEGEAMCRRPGNVLLFGGASGASAAEEWRLA